MEVDSQISEFGKILIFLIMGILMVLFTFFISSLISIKRPSILKNSSYECGEEPSGNSWSQFNSRFYVIALVFLLFDVEMIFIFPWATVFGDQTLIAIDSRWGWLSLIEMFVFVGILLLGLAYIWIKGDLNWIKPDAPVPQVDSKIPASIYERINLEKYQVKVYTEMAVSAVEAPKQIQSSTSFRPRIIKRSEK